MLQFATHTQLKAFDLLFGKYTWFGFEEPNPKTGETVDAQLSHHIFHMGSGVHPSKYTFKQQSSTNNRQYGVDLKLDDINLMLGISVRYQKQLALEIATVTEFLNVRNDARNGLNSAVDESSRLVYNHVNHEFQSTIKTGAIFNHNGCTYRVIEDYDAGKSYSLCVVTSSVNISMTRDSRHNFTHNVIHREICVFLQSIFS